METASLAVLDYAAKYREELLYNRYQAGRNAIARYTKEPPYAYIVPQVQRDPGAAVALLRRLAFLGVRVSELTRDATHGGARYAKGTWVIPMDQEYAGAGAAAVRCAGLSGPARGEGGAPEPPYDAAGWTLPYQMDVRVVEARVPLPAEFRSALQPVQGKADRCGIGRCAVDHERDGGRHHAAAGAHQRRGRGNRRRSRAERCLPPAEPRVGRRRHRAFRGRSLCGVRRGRGEARGLGDRTVAPRRAQGGRRSGQCAGAGTHRRCTARCRRAWTRGGPSGCSTSTSSSTP